MQNFQIHNLTLPTKMYDFCRKLAEENCRTLFQELHYLLETYTDPKIITFYLEIRSWITSKDQTKTALRERMCACEKNHISYCMNAYVSPFQCLRSFIASSVSEICTLLFDKKTLLAKKRFFHFYLLLHELLAEDLKKRKVLVKVQNEILSDEQKIIKTLNISENMYLYLSAMPENRVLACKNILFDRLIKSYQKRTNDALARLGDCIYMWLRVLFANGISEKEYEPIVRFYKILLACKTKRYLPPERILFLCAFGICKRVKRYFKAGYFKKARNNLLTVKTLLDEK